MMDIRGLGQLIQGGAGAGILPNHFIQQRQNSALQVIQGSGQPLVNKISLLRLRERSHTPEAMASMEFLVEQLRPSSHQGDPPLLSRSLQTPHLQS